MIKPFSLVLAGTIAGTSFALSLAPRTDLNANLETLAFHLGVTLACYCVLKLVDLFRNWRSPSRPVSAVRQQFRLSLIPLTLFYSSLTKYFLLLLLTVWMPTSRSGAPSSEPLPEWATKILPDNDFAHNAVKILDDDRLDREWVVRNVLGGMSAGFGLRGTSSVGP